MARGSPKEEVLDEMGHAIRRVGLVARTGADHQRLRYRVHVGELEDQHLKAVGQSLGLHTEHGIKSTSRAQASQWNILTS
jgi:hypothetical protein